MLKGRQYNRQTIAGFPNVGTDLASKSYLHINLLVIFFLVMMCFSFIQLNSIWGRGEPHKKNKNHQTWVPPLDEHYI